MKAEIIRMLEETNGFVSGQELCDKLGVSRTAIWKVVNQLKEEGYEIESVTRKGYRLLCAPDKMDVDQIKKELGKLGRTEDVLPIFYYDSIDSTNNCAARMANEGAKTLLVVADEQTAGKGRRGRSWDSKPGTGIYMTLLIRPQIDPNHASMLTLVTALATTAAINACLGKESQLKTKIKWPNDIVIDGHKIVGILTEMSAQMDYINHIVIGIGINVHNEEFPEEIAATAGSIYTTSGVKIKRASLIAHFLLQFEKYYATFLETEDLSGLTGEYNSMLVNCDKEVRILDPKEPFEGVARGINEKGELLVETAGEIRAVSSGEVSVRGLYGYV